MTHECLIPIDQRTFLDIGTGVTLLIGAAAVLIGTLWMTQRWLLPQRRPVAIALAALTILAFLPIQPATADHIDTEEECVFQTVPTGFGTGHTFTGLWGFAANDVYMGVRVSTTTPIDSRVIQWDGDSFNTIGSPVARVLNHIWGASNNDIWMSISTVTGSNNKGPWHWDGATWTETSTNSAVSRAFRGTWMASPTDGWTVDSNSESTVRDRIFRWDGATWTLFTAAPDTTRLFSVFGFASNDVWATGGVVAGPAVLLHWDGAAWTDVSSALPRTNFGGVAIWGLAANDIYLTANSGVTATSGVFRWNGATWTEINTGFTSFGFLTHGTSSTNLWFGAGTETTALVVHGQGMGYTQVPTSGTGASTVQRIWSADSENVWIVDNNGIAAIQGCHPCLANSYGFAASADTARSLAILIGVLLIFAILIYVATTVRRRFTG